MGLSKVSERSTLREAVTQALRTEAAELSPFTEATYRRRLWAFCEWYAAQYGAEATVATFTEDVITRYLQWSAMRVRAATVRLRRSALRWMTSALAAEIRHAGCYSG